MKLIIECDPGEAGFEMAKQWCRKHHIDPLTVEFVFRTPSVLATVPVELKVTDPVYG